MVKRFVFSAGVALLALGGDAAAQVDHLQIVIDQPNAAGTNSLASYGYSPAADTAFTSTFQAGGAIRGITGVGGAQSSTIYVTEAQLQLFYRDGNPDRGVSNPLISGMVLNPKPVGSFPAYSFAILTDGGFTRLPSSNTTDPAATKRVYRYNLQPVGAGQDGRDVMTSLVTLADMGALQNTTSTSSNTGRQGAFSGDGASFYFLDTSTAYGGLYKTNVLTGATSLLVDTSGINTEPGVLPAPAGGDRVIFQGTTANSNVGGLNFVDHTATSTSAEQSLVSAAALADFLQKPVGAADVFSVTTDAAGNVYFFDTNADVMVRRDPQGRLSKVVTNVERAAFRDQVGKTGNVNGNMLRLQTRTVTHPTAGQVTQILYAEQTPQNYVAGVYAFEAGDFNRDGQRTAADINLFKPVLTTRNVPLSGPGNYRFEMNGNAVVDFKDVKVLQPFFDFGNGDVNINGLVDFADFLVLRDNFGTTSRTFIQGDLDGDDDVDASDFLLLQDSFGYRSTVLGDGIVAAPFNQAEWDAFIAAIPEPGAVGVLGVALAGLLRRRQRQG